VELGRHARKRTGLRPALDAGWCTPFIALSALWSQLPQPHTPLPTGASLRLTLDPRPRLVAAQAPARCATPCDLCALKAAGGGGPQAAAGGAGRHQAAGREPPGQDLTREGVALVKTLQVLEQSLRMRRRAPPLLGHTRGGGGPGVLIPGLPCVAAAGRRMRQAGGQCGSAPAPPVALAQASTSAAPRPARPLHTPAQGLERGSGKKHTLTQLVDAFKNRRAPDPARHSPRSDPPRTRERTHRCSACAAALPCAAPARPARKRDSAPNGERGGVLPRAGTRARTTPRRRG
jgi:hypothetical protein